MKLDVTRYGATQTALLFGAQVDRLIDELTHARLEMLTQAHGGEQAGETR
ncbi:hypothetical protein [Micromonospora sp. NPDC005220]